jgi:hypothetical protein
MEKNLIKIFFVGFAKYIAGSKQDAIYIIFLFFKNYNKKKYFEIIISSKNGNMQYD